MIDDMRSVWLTGLLLSFARGDDGTWMFATRVGVYRLPAGTDAPEQVASSGGMMGFVDGHFYFDKRFGGPLRSPYRTDAEGGGANELFDLPVWDFDLLAPDLFAAIVTAGSDGPRALRTFDLASGDTDDLVHGELERIVGVGNWGDRTAIAQDVLVTGSIDDGAHGLWRVELP